MSFEALAFVIIDNSDESRWEITRKYSVESGVHPDNIWRKSRIEELALMPESELNRVTHVICHQGVITPECLRRRLVPTVLSSWISDSSKQQKLLPTKPYSADKRHSLRNMFVCLSDTPEADKEFFQAALDSLGARFSEDLAKSTTHLIHSSGTSNEKVAIAKHYNSMDTDSKIHLGSPEWLMSSIVNNKVEDDSVSRWPTRFSWGYSLEGQKLMIDNSFRLSKTLLKVICSWVESVGGHVTDDYKMADHLITSHRVGEAYSHVVKNDLCAVGNWHYFFNLLQGETPGLLSFPFCESSVLEEVVLCQTNYAGEARAYIEKLARLLGAKVTKSLTVANTHLVCARDMGRKYDFAKDCGMKIVSHLWLEETYYNQLKAKESLFPCSTAREAVTGIGSYQINPALLASRFDGTVSDSEGGSPPRTKENPIERYVSANVRHPEVPDDVERMLDTSSFQQFLPAKSDLDDNSTPEEPATELSEHFQTAQESTLAPESALPDTPFEEIKPRAEPGNSDRENKENIDRRPTSRKVKAKTEAAPEKSAKKVKVEADTGKPYDIRTVITGHDSLSKADLKKLANIGIKVLDKPQDGQNCIIAPSLLRTEKFLVSISKGLAYMLHTQFLTDVLGTLDMAPRLTDFRKLMPTIDDYPLEKYLEYRNEKVKNLFFSKRVGPQDIVNMLTTYEDRVQNNDPLFGGCHFNLSQNLVGGVQVVGGIIESFGATYSHFVPDKVVSGDRQTVLLCNEDERHLISAFRKKVPRGKVVEWNWVVKCIFTGKAAF